MSAAAPGGGMTSPAARMYARKELDMKPLLCDGDNSSDADCSDSGDSSVGPYSSAPASPICALGRDGPSLAAGLSAPAKQVQRTLWFAVACYFAMGVTPFLNEYLLKPMTSFVFPQSPEDPGAPRTAAQLAAELAPLTLLLLLGNGPAWLLAKRWWPEHSDPIGMMDLIFSMPFYPVLAWYACTGAWDTAWTLESRWMQSSPRARFFCELYVARQLTHLLIQLPQKMTRQQLVLMTLHHSLSVACFMGGLVTGRMQFWGCLDGVCEITTLFLNNMLLMRELDGWKDGKAYAVNGVALWMSFLLFRVCLFPTWLWMWGTDVTTNPEATWEAISTVERYQYPAVTIFLLALSVFWFHRLTLGMLKALGVTGKSKKD